MNYNQASQMQNSMRGETRYGDFLRQGLNHAAGAPEPPPPPTADSNEAFDPNMDREADIEVMKRQLLASSKNQR